MPSSDPRVHRQRRMQLKAQGMVYVRGWVTRAQAEAIRTIMNGRAVVYEPDHNPKGMDAVAHPVIDDPQPVRTRSGEAVGQADERRQKKPQLRPKSGRPGAWTVWLGNDELGTVYRHRVDEDEQSITVWVAYRPHGHNTRHETREHAVETLLQEYKRI